MAEKKYGNTRHGMYGTPTYKSWAEMKYRCGTRYWSDITYDESWNSFEQFFKDMGERPKGTTLDRINVYGNYCKDNCRWANPETQANNKRNNTKFEVNGQYLTLSQISRAFGISRSNLANKVYLYKMPINEAIEYLVEKRGCLKSQKEECLPKQ